MPPARRGSSQARRPSAGWRSVRGIAGLALAATACSGAGGPPNVLLVTFDTTRYDRFGCTGDPTARTPVVDGLAARGLLFERAYASVALTLPSHATILSGLEPLAHGVHNNGRFGVPEDVETLAERLGRAGFDTAGFVAAFVLDRRFRLDQGFAAWGDETDREADPLGFGVPERPGAEVTDEALGWLAGRGSEGPFFLWVHYYDPHQPLRAPEPFASLPDAYGAEIAYADAQLGRLLEGAKAHAAGRPTLVVFTADHGEGLGAHGEHTHGILAYDSTLHVPLVLAGPGVPRGVRSRVLARHVDVVPTVLAAVGLPVPAELPGRDLLAAARAAGAEAEVVGYFESRGPHLDHGWAPLEGVRTGRWKYTATPAPPELYDLRADPHERENRAEAEPEVRARLAALHARLRQEAARSARAARPLALEPEELERLAALGYVEAAGRYPPGEEPDPRPLAAVFSWVDQARSAASSGRYGRAIEMLETLAESPSVRPLVLRSLAPVYAESGRPDDAVAAYRDYIALTGAAEARLGLAGVLLRAGRPADALAALAELPGPSPRGEVLRAHALARLGRQGEAREAVDRAFAGRGASARLRQRAALVIDVAPLPDGEQELRQLRAAAPDDPALGSQLGYYLALWGRPEQAGEALALLREAAGEAADDADLLANLGWGAHRLGRHAEAVAALEAALALEPRRHLERARLAFALRASGEAARARGLLQAALAARPGAPWAPEAREALEELEAELASGPGARLPGPTKGGS